MSVPEAKRRENSSQFLLLEGKTSRQDFLRNCIEEEECLAKNNTRKTDNRQTIKAGMTEEMSPSLTPFTYARQCKEKVNFWTMNKSDEEIQLIFPFCYGKYSLTPLYLPEGRFLRLSVFLFGRGKQLLLKRKNNI
jgi:hypothetical protein